jgi:hypothetical protein
VKLAPFERPAATIEPPPHPHEGETWFQNLPPERRAEMARQHREGLERMQELVALEKRRMWIESLRMGAAYAFGDWCSPRGSLGSLGLALLLGTVLGLACNRLDAHRLLSALLGGGSFFLFEWLQRGGLEPRSFFIFYPIIALCALIGYAREERGML